MGFEAFATFAAAGLNAAGQVQQGQANAAAAGYNAKVAAQNAEIQTQNANFAGAKGEQDVAAQSAKTKAAIGETLAAQGASGVDVNTGSSVNIRESEAKLGMLDALTVRSNAAKEAYNYQVGASQETAQAQLLRQQQKADKTGGYLNAFSTVLGGAGKASQYSTWLKSTSPVGY